MRSGSPLLMHSGIRPSCSSLSFSSTPPPPANSGGTPAPEEEPCSKALGFNESLVPKDRSYQDLQACDEHHKRTCCERNHTAKVRIALTAFSLERSQRCSKMGQLALCSMCDGDVGVGVKSSSNVVLLCPSFCDRWFQACIDDFFTASGSGDGLAPCSPGALVCGVLGEITQDAASFCSRIGASLGVSFAMAEAEDEPDHCFDGVPAARSRGAAAKAAWVRPPRTTSWQGPWWRRMMPPSLLRALSSARVPRFLQDYGLQIALAVVVILFVGFILRSAD